jgi:uncharacterized membrane-anchored protein
VNEAITAIVSKVPAASGLLDKPLAKGGLDLSRPVATLVLAVAIVGLIMLLPQRAGGHPIRAAA